MVRRVGFGRKEEQEQPHKRHVGRHKRVFGIMEEVEKAEQTAQSEMRRNRRRKQKLSDRIKDPLIPRDNSPRGKQQARWIIIAFLSVWLAGWSYGIYTAFEAFTRSSGGTSLFLLVWLTGAGIGWAFAVVILFVMLFGKEKTKKKSKT
jgi:hypothetical protein